MYINTLKDNDKNAHISIEIKYEINKEGKLNMDMKFDTTEALPKQLPGYLMSSLPRIGIRFSLSKSYSNVTW